MWDKMNSFLTEDHHFQLGGIILPNGDFINQGLFDKKEWEGIQSQHLDKDDLADVIQNKVSYFDTKGIDVLFPVQFKNNQGDFRKEGAELKNAIDMVNPYGLKVDVLGHSMGNLATASYISGISGKDYENDIDNFIAIGAPFNGSDFAQVGRLATSNPIGNWGMGLFSLDKHGPAYDLLVPGSEAITELQQSWKGAEYYGINAWSLQSKPNDGVVSWESSTSLSGFIDVQMPWEFHTNEADVFNYEYITWDIFTKNE
jgi:hypothetical protein